MSEATIRVQLSQVFETERAKRGLSVTEVAALIGCSEAEATILLDSDLPGDIELRTIAAAAHVFGVDLEFGTYPLPPGPSMWERLGKLPF